MFVELLLISHMRRRFGKLIVQKFLNLLYIGIKFFTFGKSAAHRGFDTRRGQFANDERGVFRRRLFGQWLRAGQNLVNFFENVHLTNAASFNFGGDCIGLNCQNRQ